MFDRMKRLLGSDIPPPQPPESDPLMRCVVGLGNPGREYAATRHNIGFMIVDELHRRANASPYKQRFKSLLADGHLMDHKTIFLKPQTYMNLSGTAVSETVNWYKLSVDQLLVVQDDLDLPFGQLRFRARGSAGGHNGLASIIQRLSTTDVARLKIGIGRGRNAVGHVLGRFSPDEESQLSEVVTEAANAVELWLRDGLTPAMNQINCKATQADTKQARSKLEAE